MVDDDVVETRGKDEEISERMGGDRSRGVCLLSWSVPAIKRSLK